MYKITLKFVTLGIFVIWNSFHLHQRMMIKGQKMGCSRWPYLRVFVKYFRWVNIKSVCSFALILTFIIIYSLMKRDEVLIKYLVSYFLNILVFVFSEKATKDRTYSILQKLLLPCHRLQSV